MTGSSNEFLTTRELAELLRIKERKVYELASSGEIPCSRATGKLLFPRLAVAAWIARRSSGPVPGTTVQRPNVLLGSHDPLLEWALRESRSGLATYLDGSLDGVERFAKGEGVAAGLHLYAPEADAWNEPLIRRRFGTEPVALIEFAWRDRGLIVAPHCATRIRGIADLRGQRVTPRQAEAGSQVLLDQLLAGHGLTHADLDLTAAARSETDAAIAVLDGKADAAFGLRCLARQYQLGFVPIVRERFDLLVDRRSWFEPPLQRLFGFCRSPAFTAKAEALQGYDATGTGQVRFNGA
jgi:excisionase family DNA binding protein